MRWVKQWTATSASPAHPERNEDCYWIAAGRRAAAVIDGMGGYRRKSTQGEIGGEHASELARKILAESLDRWDGCGTLEETRGRLSATIEAVNRAISEQLNRQDDASEEGQACVGVALTLVALCENRSQALFAQHGDTHGYLLQPDGTLLRATEDQDLLLWERRQGLITEEEAERIGRVIDHFDGTDAAGLDGKLLRYFFNNNIFGALGVERSCPPSGWSVVPLATGDRIALLSDGAYFNLNLQERAVLLADAGDPADQFIERARQRSRLPRFPDPAKPGVPFNLRATQDDMTVVVLEVGNGNAPSTAGRPRNEGEADPLY